VDAKILSPKNESSLIKLRESTYDEINCLWNQTWDSKAAFLV